jgi:hypothetical protein
MRVCSGCKKSRWEGKKVDGKFICIECLARKAEKISAAVAFAEEGEVRVATEILEGDKK